MLHSLKASVLHRRLISKVILIYDKIINANRTHLTRGHRGGRVLGSELCLRPESQHQLSSDPLPSSMDNYSLVETSGDIH